MPFVAEDAGDEMTVPAEQVLAEFRYVVVFDRVHDIECVWMTARRTLAEDHQRARHDVGPLDGDRNRRRFVHHRSEEHTSELQSLMRISYAVFCLKKNNTTSNNTTLTSIKHYYN